MDVTGPEKEGGEAGEEEDLLRGQAYTASLSGFPPFLLLALKLRRLEGGGDATLAPSVMTDVAGAARVDFRVPSASVAGDGYYLEARDRLRLVVGASSMLSVVEGRRRRRLWGPIMRV